jgi:hypothetical protein
MENEFIDNPITLHIMGLDMKGKTLYEKEVWIWKGAIGAGKIGGDSREYELTTDEEKVLFSNEDIFDIPELTPAKDTKDSKKIGFERKIEDLKPVKQVKEAQTKKKTKQHKHESRVIKEFSIYPEDRINEFKDKIALVSKIAPYKQHLYAYIDETVVPMRYKLITDNNVIVDVNKIFAEVNHVLDIPIDINLFQNKDTLTVEAYDMFTTMRDMYKNFGITEYYMISVDEFFQPNIKILQETIRNDSYQFQLLYYGLVVKLWPMMTPDVFQKYILAPHEMRDTFPDLMIPSERKYVSERDIIDYKYRLLSDAEHGYKKFPGFKKYSPQLSIGDRANRNGDMSMSIKSAVLESIATIGLSKLNIRNLFNQLHITHHIPLIKVRLMLNNQSLVLTKIEKPSLNENDPRGIQRVYDKIKYRLQINTNNSILLVIRIPEKLFRQSDLENNYLVFVITDGGHYTVKSSWGDEVQMEFQTVYKIIEAAINPTIGIINKFGHTIFEGVNHLPFIQPNNTKFSSLNLNIIWHRTTTQSEFQSVIAYLRDDMMSGIIKSSEIVDQPGSVNFAIAKGITEYDPTLIEKNMVLWNYYEYLSNSKVKQRWNSLFERGRQVSIMHRTSDIKIEVIDIREKEFEQFYQYIVSFLYRTETKLKKSPKSTEESGVKKNMLKILKSRDPDLYVFKRYGSDVVYSRICQKDHQPIPYTETEYKALPDAKRKKVVKYWNFTNKSPMWYLCPNTKYPHLSFITGQHPRDYCLPCCKKMASSEEEDSDTVSTKKSHVYNTCIDTHVYNDIEETTIASRYIMNYGKPVEIGRISHLPDMLDKYLLYNLSDQEIVDDITSMDSYRLDLENGSESKLYSISKIKTQLRRSRIHVVQFSELRFLLEKQIPHIGKTWLQVIKSPDVNPQIYQKIQETSIEPLIIHWTASPKAPNGVLIHLILSHSILAKAAMLGKKDIEVKYINPKQMAAAMIKNKETAITGSGFKKQGYYLYGVPQNNANIMNIGAGFSIASSIGITFEEFIAETIKIIKQNDVNYFKILLKNRLELYFDDMSHLISVMNNLFLRDKILLDIGTNSKFTMWNELFIDMARLCHNKYVLVFDDISMDISGTSIKVSRIIENMDIILSDKAALAPNTTRDYILLLRKRKKTRTFFTSNYLFYPIYIINPHDFFKDSKIQKRIYNQEDEFMKLITQLVQGSLTEQVANQTEINLLTVLDYIKTIKHVSLDKVLINSKNMCYAIILIVNGKSMLLPVGLTTYTDVGVTRKPFYREDVTASWDMVYNFIKGYNEYIIDLSEKAGMYRVMEGHFKPKNELNRREMKILPISALIKINKFLHLGTGIIGFRTSSQEYVYFKPLKTPPIFKPTQYNLMEDIVAEQPNVYNLMYDPDIVNKLILQQAQKEESPISSKELSRALYNKYLYSLLVVQFITKLDSDRNLPMRRQVSKIVSSANFKNVDSIRAMHKKISDLVPVEDAASIKAHVDEYLNTHFDRKLLIQTINEIIYNFDRVTLNKLNVLSNGFDKLTKEEQHTARKVLVKKVTKIVDTITVVGTPKFTDEQANNVFAPCNYCKGSKLVVPSGSIPDLVSILVDDICNPLKRGYILSPNMSNIQDYYHFSKGDHEEIYVKLGT